MRLLAVVPVSFSFAAAQVFTPDTDGLGSVVSAVLQLALMLVTTAVVLGVVWFAVDLWMHRR